MARIRTIKPEFWTHHIMGRVSDSVKCMAIALLNHADDEGYFLADPHIIRSACRPFDDDSRSSHGLITELSRIGWIELCKTDEGFLLGRIVKFKENQVINRPRTSKLKGSWNSHGLITDASLTRHTRNGMEGKGMEQGRESILSDFEQKTAVEKIKPSKPLSEYSDDFLKFWSAYPSKTGKGAAFKSWKKIKPPIEKVILAIEWQKKSHKWREGYIPNPQTYINQRRWEDEPDTSTSLKVITTSRGQDRINGAMEVLARRSQSNGRSEETKGIIEIGRSI